MDPEPSGNQFIDSLPRSLRDTCVSSGSVVRHAAGDVLAHKGSPHEWLFFPISGMISEVEEGSDGGSAEITVIGFEGCSGIEALLGSQAQPHMSCTEVPSVLFALPVRDVRRLYDSSPDFRRQADLYVAAKLRGLGISIGCYARHPVPARLARWLLRVRDRVNETTFNLTHDTIARMLGVRRATVTKALFDLSAAGAIVTVRSQITIVRPDVLERQTCSCYPDARDVFRHLYGDSAKSEIS